ncbi:LytR/AlgR family response regulator transcription factor [Paenibacillus zanthoxyli]|uniref:LytR/AlgR family response regulator transcription factor n=1 Tax=Paenibacillus zanthoxyli TaxID=369399 RepID=UPI00046E68F1|nr:response regulator transcription factor [Paenibacillus zanthoxyli]
MFHVGVCDDEVEMHAQLQHFFTQFSAQTPYTFNIRCFSSGEKLLQYYKDKGPYAFHVLFLDVEMSGMNGIETARSIRSLPDRDVHIIFLTSYPEYLMDSFDVQTFQYLIKPISYELFSTKMVKVCDYILSSVTRFLCVKTKKEQIILRSSDIIAILKIKHSLVQNKLKVITSQQQYTITGTLTEFLNSLGDLFLLIHRSVIINLEHIRKFTSVSVVMSNQDQFPLGRSRAKSIKDAYALYMAAHFKERG